jgi:hypothetical protein
MFSLVMKKIPVKNLRFVALNLHQVLLSYWFIHGYPQNPAVSHRFLREKSLGSASTQIAPSSRDIS